jgi:hypothetical protein
MTRRQRALARELSEINRRLRLHADVAEVEPDLRITHLELAKRHLVSGEVLRQYVLMDEHLNAVMASHFFGWDRPFPRLWRTKRFKAFNYYVLEKLYLLQKLDFVGYLYGVPKKVGRDLRALNDLRNALAHSFFPENRRVKPSWKGQDIFSLTGLDSFLEDMSDIADFFVDRFWTRRKRKGNPSFA